MKLYSVYILASKTKTLYTGMTSSLRNRVSQHKEKVFGGFTKRYNINKLMYYEVCTDVRDAIAREKQIKGLLRKKKIELIETFTPEWKDLSDQL